MDKVFHEVTIFLDDQNVIVYPTETYDGIIVQAKELDGSASSRMYLNEAQMEFLIVKMKEMMNYVKEK